MRRAATRDEATKEELKSLTATALARVGDSKLPTECVACGINPPRFRGASTCLECAREACQDITSDAWTTGFDGAYAVARKVACESQSQNQGHCESCMGTKWISHDEYSATGRMYPTTEACPGHELAGRLDLFNRAKLPARHHACSFDNYEAYKESQGAIRDYIRQWCAEYRPDMPGQRGILLGGKHGVGKTHLLVSIARYLTVQAGESVLFIDCLELIDQMRSCMSAKGDVDALLAPYKSAPVLIIDELGRGQMKPDDWRVGRLEGLFIARYNRPTTTTIAATNASDSDLNKSLHERIMSRLAEQCEQRILMGPDHRREGGRT